MSNKGTIVAISTAHGNAAVGIIRISGTNVKKIMSDYSWQLSPRLVKYVKLKNEKGDTFDDALLIFFEAPSSYTGEDMLEIQMHGNSHILEYFQKELCKKYTRLANPGEFTERAFLNNKIDLVQAEAVMDLINSNNSNSAVAAQRSLQGAFSDKISMLKKDLLEIRMKIEATINFPEDETSNSEPNDLSVVLQRLSERFSDIILQSESGIKLNNNLVVTILGRPNAGKSSLSNTLLGENCSIVSSEAGTTRDILRNNLMLGSNVVTLLDTAGLRDGKSEVEDLGIELSFEASSKSDLVLYVIDVTEGITTDDNKYIEKLPANCWIIYNKIDLTKESSKKEVMNNRNIFYVSALDGQGMDLIRDEISSLKSIDISDGLTTARQRHVDSLSEALKHLYNSIQYNDNQQLDIVAEELRLAHVCLETILGGDVSEELLDAIFSEFCIGK